MNRDEALRKLKSLLRLAERGGTAAEAAVAASKAQEIMDRHEFGRTEISLDPEPEEGFRDFGNEPGGWLDSTTKREHWREQLAIGLARLNGCHIYRSRVTIREGNRVKVRFRVEIVGRPAQAETVRYLYGWLAREIVQLRERLAFGESPRWKRSFCMGAALEVALIMEQRRRSSFGSIVPATLDPDLAKAWADENMKILAGRQRKLTQDDHARAVGRSAARTMIDMESGKAPLPGARRRSLPESAR